MPLKVIKGMLDSDPDRALALVELEDRIIERALEQRETERVSKADIRERYDLPAGRAGSPRRAGDPDADRARLRRRRRRDHRGDGPLPRGRLRRDARLHRLRHAALPRGAPAAGRGGDRDHVGAVGRRGRARPRRRHHRLGRRAPARAARRAALQAAAGRAGAPGARALQWAGGASRRNAARRSPPGGVLGRSTCQEHAFGPASWPDRRRRSRHSRDAPARPTGVRRRRRPSTAGPSWRSWRRARSTASRRSSTADRRTLALDEGTSSSPSRRGGRRVLDGDRAAPIARALFGLDQDPAATRAALGDDPVLGPLVRARPGLRVPGGASGFEVAVRAVVGQQISVAAARTLLGRIAARGRARAHGDLRASSPSPPRWPPRPTTSSRCRARAPGRCASWPRPTRRWPTPARRARADRPVRHRPVDRGLRRAAPRRPRRLPRRRRRGPHVAGAPRRDDRRRATLGAAPQPRRPASLGKPHQSSSRRAVARRSPRADRVRHQRDEDASPVRRRPAGGPLARRADARGRLRVRVLRGVPGRARAADRPADRAHGRSASRWPWR